MQLNQRDVTKNFRTGYYLPATPGSNAGVGAPRFFFGFRPSESRRRSDADILGALSVLAFARYPARLKVIGKITATGRRCWAYSRALIAEWRRRARSRGELGRSAIANCWISALHASMLKTRRWSCSGSNDQEVRFDMRQIDAVPS